MSEEEKLPTFILKEQIFQWIGFDDFVKYIKANTKYPHWTGMFQGLQYTHEHDSLYLIGGGYSQVRFHSDDVLCILNNGRPFILKHPLIDFIKPTP